MKDSEKPHPTWETLISLPGIEQAMKGLGYRSRRSLKYRLVDTLRAFHEQEGEAASVKGYDSDELIRLLWNTGKDGVAQTSKRRNLSSLRSSVNADLMALYRKGENPEGVIISPENTFIPCEEAKNQTLEALKSLSGNGEGSPDPKRIGEILKGLQELLSQARETRPGEMKMEAAAFNEIQGVVRGLARDLGLVQEGKGGVLSPGTQDHALEPVQPSGQQGTGDGEIEEAQVDEEAAVEADEEVTVLEEDDVPEDSEIVEEEVEEELPDEACEDVEVIEDEARDALEEDDAPEDEEIAEEAVEEEVPDEDYEEEGVLEEDEAVLEEDDAPEDSEIVEEAVEEVPDEACEEEVLEEDEDALEEDDGLEDAEIVEEEAGEELPDEACEDVEVIEDEAGDALEEEPQDADAYGEEIELEQGVAGPEAGEGVNEGEGVLDGWDFLEEEPQGAREDPERRRILSEEFNASLAAMDRFFNAYILVPEGLYPSVERASAPEDNADAHVRLPAFYIGRFPVTNALFEVFVEKTGYITTAEKEEYGTVYQGRYRCVKDERTGKQTLYGSSGVRSRRVRGACWYQPTGPGSTLRGKRNHPVVQVSLEDAMAFAAWTGKRLPTEQEWEAAMRMQEGFPYPWGKEWMKDACNVEETGIGEPSSVDRFEAHANALGIADGLGNVLEWTLTSVREEEGNCRMARGASWIAGNAVSLRSGTALPSKARSNLLGFRCVAY